jgi:predicted regulator of Ras-like GTPase activity (Roadblock/LC7/MglB family)
MLKSLFGDLGIGTPKGVQASFTPTAVHELRERVAADDGRLIESHTQDLFVDGSPAHAMREHLATVDPSDQVRVITLLDPSHAWAPALVRALSEATGQPVQRLRIRDRATERVMVTLERTIIPRRGDATLKLYHAHVPTPPRARGASDDGDRTPYMLMERSDMAVVVAGDLEERPFTRLLDKVTLAAQAMTWRCPTLVFVVPATATWMSARIRDFAWPPSVRVEVIDAAPSSPSIVWNALLSAWDRHDTSALPALALEREAAAEEMRAVARQLRDLMGTAGVVGCAVARIDDGFLVAGESHEAGVDLAQAARALAPVLQAHQTAAAAMGEIDKVEEVIVSAGSEQHVLRPLDKRPNLFIFARLQRTYANLTLARLKVAEAQRHLDA